MITFRNLGQQGRLANQLWQISAVIGTALSNQVPFILPPWKYQQYFNINQKYFSYTIPRCIDYKEPFFHYQKIPYTRGTNLNLEGYWQSYKYWNTYDRFILECFQHKLDEMRVLKRFTETHHIDPKYATSIHVRRTDYLRFPDCHPILSADYYNKAMEECKTDTYCIFSDDIEWCKYNFKGPRFKFMSGPEFDEVSDLVAMSYCKNNIIANSSFSWWGAYLNKNSDKKVIAPKDWFGPTLAKTHDTKDLYLPEWIVI